ncbi:hypothetical protein [Cupriavidus malaysiensis]|uniref:Uncharacterized protein n=1 Tax=Cupriavidus malaysiensis TaxID=367825 RepID=A0A1D9I7V5_9BURK|nr:hypothetical protein [Cupriavidus malaysiensis]AOZ08161.1 hypothetical protein BKK80_13970 [Cupriavidus malaysiensis]
MAKQKLSVEEFIAEMNSRLPSHYGYKPGLHIFLMPIGANAAEATGYDWAPKDLDTTAAVSAVHEHVASLYDVAPIPRSE